MSRAGVPSWDPRALYSARTDARLDQGTLAERAGTSRASVANYERADGHAPSPAVLVALARVLDVPPRELMARDVRGLAVLRAVAGLSQLELVERLPTRDLSVPAYKAIETGRTRRLRESDATAIAAVLGTDRDTLMREHAYDVEAFIAREGEGSTVE